MFRRAGALLSLGLACSLACAQRTDAALADAARSDALVRPTPLKGQVVLDPKLLLQLVVSRSAEIQYSKMQVEVASELSAAEAALYEAMFFTNLRKDGGERQRTVEERISSLSTSSQTTLSEQVRTLETGVRARLPTGAEVSLSYRMRNRNNNIIASASSSPDEYDGALILTMKQALLRGRGRGVIETDLKVAEAEEKIAYHQYRQQLLKTCNDALSIYWQLYRALEIRQIRQQGLDYARRVQADTGARIEAGKLPSSNMIEARAGVLVREVEQIRSVQGVREAESRLQTLLNVSGLENIDLTLVVRDRSPTLASMQGMSADQRYRQALATWPALGIAKLRAEQAGLRLNFADSQRLPGLDLVVSRSNTGLAKNYGEARSLAETARYPQWSIGLNFEMPLEGGQKARSQYRAQLARMQQAEIELASIHTALANDIRMHRDQAISGHEEVSRINVDVELRTELLRIERVRYESGLSLLSQLLQRETELSDSRQRLVESNTRLGQANDALLFADGSLLQEYGIILKE
jgi:outer membrane protein TolC